MKRSYLDLRANRNEAALAKANEVLKKQPRAFGVFLWRSQIYVLMHRYQAALNDCNQALELAKTSVRSANAPLLRARARIYWWMKEYSQGRRDLERALELNKEDPLSYNALAWFLATCPDAAWRDGKRALAYATITNQKTGGKNPAFLDTLAAAEAETGAFAAAVQHQQMAFSLDRRLALDKNAQKRLELYKNKQAYHPTLSPADEMLSGPIKGD